LLHFNLNYFIFHISCLWDCQDKSTFITRVIYIVCFESSRKRYASAEYTLVVPYDEVMFLVNSSFISDLSPDI